MDLFSRCVCSPAVSRACVAAFASVVSLAHAAAQLDESVQSDDDLRQRIADLERGINAAEAHLGEDAWLTEHRAEEIQALVGDVLNDASTRQSLLLDDGLTAGWDDDFFLRSADGVFEMEITGQLQVRYLYRHLTDPTLDQERVGFETRRTKLDVDGHILTKALHYNVKGGFDRSGGALLLQDATIDYSFADNWKVKTGRFRAPLQREEAVSSKRQLAVERSLVSKGFSQARSVGVAVEWKNDDLHFIGAVMDITPGVFGDYSWLATVRGEWLLLGEWKAYKDFTSFPADDPLVAIGLGVLAQEQDFTSPFTPDSQLVRWTADLSMEFGGVNVFLAALGNHTEDDLGQHRDQYGVTAQGGVFLTDSIEVFGRYQWGTSDDNFPDLQVVEAGFNKYFSQHQLKLTVDAGFALNEVGPQWNSLGAGWSEDALGFDGQFVVRSQLQLLF